MLSERFETARIPDRHCRYDCAAVENHKNLKHRVCQDLALCATLSEWVSASIPFRSRALCGFAT